MDRSSLTNSEVKKANELELTMRTSLAESKEELRVVYETQDLLAEQTIVVFDLHHVLMRPEYKKMARMILKHPNKKQLFKVVSSPKLLRKFVNKIGSETPEKTMKDLEKEFDADHEDRISGTLSPLISDICNAQKPDLPTFEVVERLVSSGYGVYLLSNIGIQYFNDLRANMPRDFFEHFSGFYTTNPDDDYVNKPNIKIFKR